MIRYYNIECIENLDFSDYLILNNGSDERILSHSFLKHEVNGVTPEFTPTQMTELGSLVDGILTDPARVNMVSEQYGSAKKIAAMLQFQFGAFFPKFKKQLTYTASVVYKGFKIKVCGRPDWVLPGQAVIDLKITKSSNVRSVIEWMGYSNQLWHYCKLAQVKKAYIIIHSITTRKTEIIEIDVSNDYNEFWADAILKFGIAA